MFLGGHSRIASLGELNYLSKSIAIREKCSCGSAVTDCPEWKKVFSSIVLRGHTDPLFDPYSLGLWDAVAFNLVDRNHQTAFHLNLVRARRAWLFARELLPKPLQDLIPIPPHLSAAIVNKFALATAISSAWGKSHIVDSSKNAREAVELWKARPDLVRIVLLIRDGRGVYLSRRRAGRSREESIRGWRDYYGRFIPLIERHVDERCVYRLKYEDLVRAPQDIGISLCSFLGLQFEPSMIDIASTTRHMVTGNDTRFSASKGLRADERWKSELVGDELAYFESQAGKLNEALGYQ